MFIFIILNLKLTKKVNLIIFLIKHIIVSSGVMKDFIWGTYLRLKGAGGCLGNWSRLKYTLGKSFPVTILKI